MSFIMFFVFENGRNLLFPLSCSLFLRMGEIFCYLDDLSCRGCEAVVRGAGGEEWC